MQVNGFVFYASFYEAIEELEEQDQLSVYRAICQYALTGEMPECKGAARAIMKLVQPQIDANNRRREAGKKGAEVTNASASERQDVGTDAANGRQEVGTEAPKEKVKVKDKVKDKEKEREKEKRTPFRRPSLEEVRAYCEERGNNVDPQMFFDFYESKGWRVGSQPMKDFKAAIRTWERRPRSPAQTTKTKFSNFPERSYDWNDLETRLLRAQGGTG